MDTITVNERTVSRRIQMPLKGGKWLFTVLFKGRVHKMIIYVTAEDGDFHNEEIKGDSFSDCCAKCLKELGHKKRLCSDEPIKNYIATSDSICPVHRIGE